MNLTRREFVGSAASIAAALPIAGRLGIMCALTTDERTSRPILAAAAASGFTSVQVRVPWARVDASYLRALPAWLQSEGLRPVVLGAYVNCCNPENVLMDCRREDFSRVLDLAARLRTRYVIAWTGGYGRGLRNPDPRNTMPEAYDRICSFIEAYAKRIEELGQTLALESMYTLACPSAGSLARLLKRLPACVGAVLDPPNLTSPDEHEMRNEVLRRMVATLRQRIAVIHLKDMRLRSDRQGYDFPGPLRGEMDYPLFASQIETLPETLPLVAEHLNPDEFSLARRQLLALFDRL